MAPLVTDRYFPHPLTASSCLRRQLIIFTLHILRTISQHHTVWGSSKGPRHSYSPEDTPQVLVFKKDDMFTYYNTYVKFGTISKYNLS